MRLKGTRKYFERIVADPEATAVVAEEVVDERDRFLECGFGLAEVLVGVEIEPRIGGAAETLDLDAAIVFRRDVAQPTCDHHTTVFGEENAINEVVRRVLLCLLKLQNRAGETGNRIVSQLHMRRRLPQPKLQKRRNAQRSERACRAVEQIGPLDRRGTNDIPIREYHFNPNNSSIEESVFERAALATGAGKASAHSDAREFHHHRRDEAVLEGRFCQAVHRHVRLHQHGARVDLEDVGEMAGVDHLILTFRGWTRTVGRAMIDSEWLFALVEFAHLGGDAHDDFVMALHRV